MSKTFSSLKVRVPPPAYCAISFEPAPRFIFILRLDLRLRAYRFLPAILITN